MAEQQTQLEFKLSLNEKDFVKGAKKAGKASDKLNKQNEKLGNQFDKTNKKAKVKNKTFKKTEKASDAVRKKFGLLERAGRRLTAGYIAASLALGALFIALSKLKAIVSDSIQAYQDYEKAIQEVNTLYSGSGGLLDSTKEFIKLQALTYGGTATENAKAYYQIVSAGVTDQAKANKLLEASNKAAIAGVSDVVTAVDAITSVLNVYGDTGIDAAKASDILFGTIKAGKTNFDQLGAKIGLVIPIASAAGLSFQEVSAAIADLTTKGISTAESTTLLKAVLLSLLKPAEQSRKAAKALGLEWNTTALKARGLLGVLKDLSIATDGDEEKIAKLIPSAEGLGAIFALNKNNGEGFKNILHDLNTKTGVADEAFKKMGGTLDLKVKKELVKTNEAMKEFGKVTQGGKLALIKMTSASIRATTSLYKGSAALKNYVKNMKSLNYVWGLTKAFRGIPKDLGRMAYKLIGKSPNIKFPKREKPDPMRFLNDPSSDLSGSTTGGKTSSADSEARKRIEQNKLNAFQEAAREASKSVMKYYDAVIRKVAKGIKTIQMHTEKAIKKLRETYFSGGAFSSLGDAFGQLDKDDNARFNYKQFKKQVDPSSLDAKGIASLAESSVAFEKLDNDGQDAVQQIIDKIKELKGFVTAIDIAGAVAAAEKGFFLSKDGRGLGNQLLGDTQGSFEVNKQKAEADAKRKEAEFLEKVFEEAQRKQKEIYTEALEDYKQFSGAVDLFKDNIDAFKEYTEEVKKGMNVNVNLSEDAKKFFYEEIEKGIQNSTSGFNNNAIQGGA